MVRSGQLDADACGSNIEPATCSSRYHALTASGGALWRFHDPWSVKGELSIAQRAPNTDEQYLNGAAPTFPVLALGKPDVGPETTYGTSLTLGYAGTAVKAEASGFANRIDEYVYFAPAVDAGAPEVRRSKTRRLKCPQTTGSTPIASVLKRRQSDNRTGSTWVIRCHRTLTSATPTGRSGRSARRQRRERGLGFVP